MDAPCLWYPGPSRRQNVFIAFQAGLSVEHKDRITLRMFGCSMYRVYLDGVEIMEGPARFAPEHPEYDEMSLFMLPGERLLTVVVHDYGVHTRIIMGGIPPFLQCEAVGGRGPYELRWMCRELEAYGHIDRRINAQLGWMEICDTRLLPDLSQPFDESVCRNPAVILDPLRRQTCMPKTVGDSLTLTVEGSRLMQGKYADQFGYADDDPPIRFISRDLHPDLPADGCWLRFDLGKVGLYRPSITIDVPAGTVIEAGYCEMLTHHRVFPVIPLSGSSSCHMDRWIAAGGRQTIQSFVPRGFRYIEIHLAVRPDQLGEVKVCGLQRSIYDRAPGAFYCSDPLLNKIWQAGADTLRACCEDALIDTPTRERGQWIGDAAMIGMELLSVTYGDLALIHRAFTQASYRRRADGLAAGLCPGQEAYLTSYALYWISGCLRYSRLTGDNRILHACYATARETIDFFWSRMTSRGVYRLETWDFLDWGHAVAADEINVSLNLILLQALRDLRAWEKLIDIDDKQAERDQQISTLLNLSATLYRNSDDQFVKSIPAEGVIKPEQQQGYHATVLGLTYGLLESNLQQAEAIEFVKRHMNACFPNERAAPRLAHPSANHDRLITPSFGHFALMALWEAGEADFVLDQYRSCWGWMLEQGATTLLEVFDTRWSHCHAWSGSPTWQMSRYVLGLIPVPEQGSCQFRLNFQPGALEFASGKVPLTGKSGAVAISWQQTGRNAWKYAVETDHAISVRIDDRKQLYFTDDQGIEVPAYSQVTVEKKQEFMINLRGSDYR